MFDYYKQALPSMGGYMNEQGRVRFDRLEKLMQLLADWERRQYSETHPRHHRGGGHKRGTRLVLTINVYHV